MTPHQMALVRASVREIASVSDEAGQLFVSELSAMAPQVCKSLATGCPDHEARCAQILESLLDDLAAADGPRWDLDADSQGDARAWAGMHGESTRKALLWTLQVGLGHRFTPELGAAWSMVLQRLAAPPQGR
jgi:hypothetical protein